MALPSGKIGHTDLNTDFIAVDTEPGTGKYTRVLKNRANASSELFSYPKASWIEDPSTVDDSLITTGVAYNALNGKAATSHSHSTEDISSFGDWAVISDINNHIVFKTLNTENWTAVTNSTFGKSSVYGICYGNGKFIAVGIGGRLAYSSDGISWTKVSDSKFGTAHIRGVCYGNGKFVAGGNDGKIIYSYDGTDWILVSDSKFGTTYIYNVCYGNGRYVAVGDSGKMAYSFDGVSWTLVSNSTFGTSHINSVCYGNGMFVAGGAGGKIIYCT